MVIYQFEKGKMKCPSCGNEEIILDPARGELVCSKCGLVVRESIIDYGPDWRSFSEEEAAERGHVGLPLTHPHYGLELPTEIGKEDRDIYGRRLPAERARKVDRLRTLQAKTKYLATPSRSMVQANMMINTICSNLNLPKATADEAFYVYSRAVKQGLIKGRKIKTIIAASIYIACRLHTRARTLEEVALAAGVEEKELGKCFRLLARKLGIKVPPLRPVEFIPRICRALGLSDKVQAKAVEIVRKAEEMGITAGKDPTGVAAAAVYIASVLCGERRTQRELAEVAHVTEVTVRNRYRELQEKLGIKV